MNRVFSFLLGVVLLSGCASTYEHQSLKAPAARLNPALAVLISVPVDGKYGDKLYSGSGKMTANVVSNAFAKYAKTFAITSNCHGVNCLQNIDAAKYGYYVQPVILHWEDRATEWTGIPDRVEILLHVFDTRTRQEIANISYKGKSKWLTFGGDHPQDLLPEPTNQVVESFYK